MGLLAGLLGSTVWSSPRREELLLPSLEELQELTHLEPVRVLPRLELEVVGGEAADALREGRPWYAWRMLRDEVSAAEAAPRHVLLAARAAAGWDGWTNVRNLLRERDWLSHAEGGDGLFLLARAEEELGNRQGAMAVYRRYLALPNARSRGVATARLARVLSRAGHRREAAAAFAAAAQELPEVADWLRTLQMEHLVAAGDPGATALGAGGPEDSPAARLRRVEAEAKAWISASDLTRALRRLELEGQVLQGRRAFTEAAQLQLRRAELLMRNGRSPEARELLRATAWDGGVPANLRLSAAEQLGGMPRLSVAEQLARAAAYETAGRPAPAIRVLRAALAAGAPDEGAIQLKLARLLYREHDFGPARVAFRRAAELLQDRDLLAEADLYAARSLYRAGRQSDAIPELKQVVERYEGTPAAGTALFLLGDVSSTLERAVSYYRRAAAVEGSPEAREALYRAGHRSLRLNNVSGAIRSWEEYVERYPYGEETANIAYETAKLHANAGRQARARVMYAATIAADPLSYNALLAAKRLEVKPLDRILAEPRPWIGLAADPAAAAAVLRRLSLLEGVGLRAEWEAELASAIRSFAERPAALITLAEGLRDAGHPVEGIRLGRQLLARRQGEWDARLLRVVFPFPYREILLDEAKRAGVDPMLLAGLVRQESSFQPDARSRVGATGLCQIMPATGRWLAPSVGIRRFQDDLLEVPEVSLRMGAKYLGDLMNRYDGAADLALAAYNAGPGRADRWKRELGYRRGSEAFRNAIPFEETRGYVKIVLRNAAIYEQLYGGE